MNDKISELQSKLPAWMKSGPFIGLLTFLLWIISAALSFYVLLEFQHMILRRYVLCCEENRWGFQVLRQWSSIFIVGIWLAFTVITGEFHYQHFRQEISWKVFKRSFLVMLVILVIALIL